MLGFHVPAAVATNLSSGFDLDRCEGAADPIRDDYVGVWDARRGERSNFAFSKKLHIT